MYTTVESHSKRTRIEWFRSQHKHAQIIVRNEPNTPDTLWRLPLVRRTDTTISGYCKQVAGELPANPFAVRFTIASWRAIRVLLKSGSLSCGDHFNSRFRNRHVLVVDLEQNNRTVNVRSVPDVRMTRNPSMYNLHRKYALSLLFNRLE